MKALAIALVSTGCAQVLGINNTHLPPVDAANTCDGVPDTCVSMTGRTACGQINGTGAFAGALRVASPTGAACDPGNTDGPCGLAVSAQPLVDFQAGMTTNRIGGTIDDCGRFVVLDIEPTAPDVAIIIEGMGYSESASLFLQRPAGPGVDTAIQAFALASAAQTAWSAELAGADMSTGFVVTYQTGKMPLEMEEIRVDGSMVMGPPIVPWGAYFSDSGFGTLDSTLTSTAASGSAFVVPTNTIFTIGGKRSGATCKLDGMSRVSNTVQFVTLTNC